MKKILILLFILFVNKSYALSCMPVQKENYILNTHILNANIVKEKEVEKDGLVYQSFLVKPTHFFSKKTNEKLYITNVVSSLNLKRKRRI